MSRTRGITSILSGIREALRPSLVELCLDY
jgi:hypothetical protein